MKAFLQTVLATIAILTNVVNVYSQNITINYQTWNPSSTPCDLFNTVTDVPATINGTSSAVPHVTLIGDVVYSTSDQSIQLGNAYVSGSDIRGTKYRLGYNFKVGYRYIITVTSAELNNTLGTGYAPYLRLDLSNSINSGGIICQGPQGIAPNLSGNPAAYPYNNIAFQDVQFAFSTPLAFAYSTLEITSIPAQSVSSNSIKIRKITIVETAPAPTFSISRSPSGTSICGTPTTFTFTANNPNNVSGITGYT